MGRNLRKLRLDKELARLPFDSEQFPNYLGHLPDLETCHYDLLRICMAGKSIP